MNWWPLGRSVTCADTTLSMSSITSSMSTGSVASARASPSFSWRCSVEQPGVGVLRGLLRCSSLAQREHQRVVALQVALCVGQFLALAEQALRQHLLAGQQALAQPAAEGFVADLHHALEHALSSNSACGYRRSSDSVDTRPSASSSSPARTRCCRCRAARPPAVRLARR
jgi:hypothetical protein